jgi:predicted aspartyl protease
LTLSQNYTGRSGYAADYVEGPDQLFVAVECLVGEFTVNAVLDTGCQWCILPARIAAALGETAVSHEPVERLSNRLGTFAGRLVRIPLALVAEEGETVDVDAT